MDLSEKALQNFKDICKIPRGSYDEKKISDYLKKFAEDRGYEARQDDFLNVIVKVPGTCGKENNPTVALQGHMDMVYVKTADSTHIYEEGIDTKIEGDFMSSACKTSLGADDGMAVAYCMTLMEDKSIPHPPLEILFTVQEEVGLAGAKNLDLSSSKAKYLINLDSEREGNFVTSCAGGVRNHFTIPMGKKEEIKGLSAYSIKLSGLKGGHSGMDINKGRGNGIKIMARILKNCDNEKVHLAKFSFSGKANAIAAGCLAVAGVEKDFEEEFLKNLSLWCETVKKEFAYSDTPEFKIEKIEGDNLYYKNSSKDTLLKAVNLFPFGLIAQSFAIKGLTETSVNTGSCDEIDDSIRLLSAVRSSVRSRKLLVMEKIDIIADILSCKSEFFNDYPQWDYNPVSRLRNLALKAYKELTGKEGETSAMHGGLECGYFHEALPDCDMISTGCDIYDVHSPEERFSVSSFKRTWSLLLKILEEL